MLWETMVVSQYLDIWVVHRHFNIFQYISHLYVAFIFPTTLIIYYLALFNHNMNFNDRNFLAFTLPFILEISWRGLHIFRKWTLALWPSSLYKLPTIWIFEYHITSGLNPYSLALFTYIILVNDKVPHARPNMSEIQG